MLDVRAGAGSKPGGLRVRRIITFGGVAAASLWCAASASATLATASFTTPGQYSFTVPVGVSNVQITAVGANGGSSQGTDGGGAGSSAGGVTSAGNPAAVTVPVTPGEQLYVAVGAPGARGSRQAGGAGGFGGGAAGGGSSPGLGGGGGGGASVVSAGSPFPWSLLVVAAGGGGAGYGANGGNGDSGGAGCNQSGPLSCAASGSAGTQTAGGAGGGGVGGGSAGQPGQFGFGGAGGVASGLDNDGGGGGGGYYGGGGGGSSATANIFGGGGGGGSSFVTPLATVSGPPAPASPAQVLIGYKLSGTGRVPSPGARGQTEVVLCNTTITKTVTSHGRKHKLTVHKCTSRFLAGTVKVTATRGDLAARISRGAATYATGLATANGNRRWQLVLTHRIRTLRRGLYTLTLRTRGSHPRIIKRATITLS